MIELPLPETLPKQKDSKCFEGKVFQKNISFTLIWRPTYAYLGVSNNSFSEYLACILNKWSTSHVCNSPNTFRFHKNYWPRNAI